jgi:hypothetical protein
MNKGGFVQSCRLAGECEVVLVASGGTRVKSSKMGNK